MRSWLRSGAITEIRIIPQVRYLLLGSSRKRISLTQLPSIGPVAPLVLVRLHVCVAKLNMTWRHFDKSLGCLVSPALDELATQLSSVEGLSERERDVITDATRESLYTVLHTKVSGV